MRAVIQRVQSAKVTVNGKVIGAIGPGLLTFLGAMKNDGDTAPQKLFEKIAQLRIFADEQGKMNRSLLDAKGSHLIVSQFTLAADCSSGRRPSFDSAEKPDRAKKLYEQFIGCSRTAGLLTETGEFGADMLVEIQNDGPVTFVIDV